MEEVRVFDLYAYGSTYMALREANEILPAQQSKPQSEEYGSNPRQSTCPDWPIPKRGESGSREQDDVDFIDRRPKG
jgi:replication initiation and membrane attachment protein DnaB